MLIEVELITLHGNILTEVFISVHAFSERLGWLGGCGWFLNEMEFVSLHGDVLSKVLVSIHASSEVDVRVVVNMMSLDSLGSSDQCQEYLSFHF